MRDTIKCYGGQAYLGRKSAEAGFTGDVPRQFNAVTQVLIKPGTPDEDIVRSLEITIEDVKLRIKSNNGV